MIEEIRTFAQHHRNIFIFAGVFVVVLVPLLFIYNAFITATPGDRIVYQVNNPQSTIYSAYSINGYFYHASSKNENAAREYLAKISLPEFNTPLFSDVSHQPIQLVF